MTLGELRRGLLVTQSDIAGRLGATTADIAFGGRLEAVIPAPGGTERRVLL